MEAGAACVAARAVLAASARHLLIHNNNASGKSRSTANSTYYSVSHAAAVDAEANTTLLSDLSWRYLEMGARGTVCVEALRRAARAIMPPTVRRGRGGRQDTDKGGNARGGRAGADVAAEQVEEAAASLEDGLATGGRKLKRSCRCVRAVGGIQELQFIYGNWFG